MKSGSVLEKAVIDQPLCVILDSNLQLPTDSKVLQRLDEVLVFTNSTDQQKIDSLEDVGVKVVHVDKGENGLDLEKILQHLVSLEINEVMVEAGATLTGSFIASGLVDELIIYMAPVLMGDQARALFHLPEIQQMNQKIQLNIKEMRQFGEDIRIIATLS